MSQQNIKKTIVITGASSGLGAALARAYAASGVILALLGRDERRLETVAQSCRDKGAEVYSAVIDVTDAAMMQEWISTFAAAFPLDLVIANAGISGGTGGSGFEGIDQVKQIFATNFDGVLHTVFPAMAAMKLQHYGQIALVSSVAGFRGAPPAPAYTTSKAAVRAYGQALRGLLVRDNIRVTVICPGFIRTAMTDVNPFPMPFLMEADEAAAIIKKRLESNPAQIVFPWPMALIARLQNLLPEKILNYFYGKISGKPGM